MDWNVEEQAAKGPGVTVPIADPVLCVSNSAAPGITDILHIVL